MADFSKLSTQELIAMRDQLKAQPKQAPEPQANAGAKDLSQMSTEELYALRDQVKNTQGGLNEQSFSKPSVMDSVKIGLEKGATFGARPAIAGAAGGLAGLVETLKQGKYGSFNQAKNSIGNALSTGADFFGQARNEAIEQQRVSAETNPKADMWGNIGGGLITAPLIAAKGAQGATSLARIGSAAKEGAKLGLATGVGTAAGEAQDLKDAALIAGTSTALGGATGGAFQGISEGAKALANTKAGQTMVGAGKRALALPIKAMQKISSALTGVNEQDIATYSSQTDKVDKIIKSTGGDISGEADRLRQGVQDSIRAKRQQLSGQISQALSELPNDVQLNAIPVLQKLREMKNSLNPKYSSGQVAALDEMINKIGTQSKAGLVTPKILFETKEYLQDLAKSAYLKDGQIFQNAKEVQVAAKQAAAIARKELNNFLGEGSAIPQANKMLSELHILESRLNRNLIKPGGPESALLAAARGNNARNTKMLGKLGELTGKDILGDARNLSAAQAFSSAGPFSFSNTGRSALGYFAGDTIGDFIGGSEGAATGKVVGMALSSPYALKKAIQMGVIPRTIIQNLSGDKAIKRANEFLQSGQGQAALANSSIERRLRKAGGQ